MVLPSGMELILTSAPVLVLACRCVVVGDGAVGKVSAQTVGGEKELVLMHPIDRRVCSSHIRPTSFPPSTFQL